MGPCRRLLAAAVLGASVLALGATAAQAQVIRGTLRDRATGQPIEHGAVVLYDSLGTARSQALTNSRGAFLLRTDRMGFYYVESRALGYETTVGDTVPLFPGQELEVLLLVDPLPVRVEGVSTTVSRKMVIDSWLVADFYNRAATGRGRYVTRTDIERRNPVSLTDLLQSVPGLWVERTGAGFNDWSVGVRRQRSRFLANRTEAQTDSTMQARNALNRFEDELCVPLLWLDGVEQKDALYMINYIEPSIIEGLEVYRSRLETPGEYAKPGSECGSILVWTRRGR